MAALIFWQLDFEKYQKRVETGRSKTKRSDRDNASLEKAEVELVRAKDVCGELEHFLQLDSSSTSPCTLCILGL